MTTGGGGGGGDPTTVRLGYFPNLTHAGAIIGVESGIYEDALGDNTLETSTFSDGTEATEALLAGAIDATFIGPNPAINAFAQSNGEAVRVVAGATSGGAALVTTPDITAPEQLEGTTLSSPSLGNTQDVALRAYLADQGFETDEEGGGDVSIQPQENADTLRTFQSGEIDGAWVPEPWATRLVQEGGGEILVDERDLWPDGQFVTTHLLVRRDYLEENPEVIRSLLEGHVEATQLASDDPEQAQSLVNQGIEAITGEAIPEDVIATAYGNLEFTVDPIASSLRKSASDAEELGLLDPVELEGIYDLSLLNEVLAEAEQEPVEGL